jgi:hypothetical protein
VAAVPIVDMEGRGVGKAFGGLVGGAVAAAGGIHLGMAAAGLVIPGIGPVVRLMIPIGLTAMYRQECLYLAASCNSLATYGTEYLARRCVNALVRNFG